jgi:cbb3-type cytochrome oxidase maturation protein
VEVLIVLIFVSLVLTLLGVALFVSALRQKQADYADRLALLPLDDRAERRALRVDGTESEKSRTSVTRLRKAVAHEPSRSA